MIWIFLFPVITVLNIFVDVLLNAFHYNLMCLLEKKKKGRLPLPLLEKPTCCSKFVHQAICFSFRRNRNAVKQAAIFSVIFVEFLP